VFFYLRQLSGKLDADDAAWDVPWIGMDRSMLARIMLFSTLLIAPMLAIILLCERAASVILLGGPAATWSCRGWTWHPAITTFQWMTMVGLILAVLTSAFLGIRSWMFRPEAVENDTSPIASE
jgi:hypothetical protein